jgi:hypothetical protein
MYWTYGAEKQAFDITALFIVGAILETYALIYFSCIHELSFGVIVLEPRLIHIRYFTVSTTFFII